MDNNLQSYDGTVYGNYTYGGHLSKCLFNNECKSNGDVCCGGPYGAEEKSTDKYYGLTYYYYNSTGISLHCD